MNLVPAKCPQCGADVGIVPRQEICRCNHCGSRLVIEWTSGDSAKLTRSDLERVKYNTSYTAARTRLPDLPAIIEKAQGEVALQQTELQSARSRLQSEARLLRAHADSTRNWMMVIATIGVVALYCVAFVLEGEIWYWFILLTLGCAMFSWQMYKDWQKERVDVERKVDDLYLKAVRPVEELAQAAEKCLEKYRAEEVACQRTVESYEFSE